MDVEQFLKDIAGHEMNIKIDNGVYRHIEFRNQKSGNYWFELVTWPRCLCITGDMGTFTFSRLQDMFVFFIGPINLGYWAEKATAGECQELSVKTIKYNVMEYFDDDDLGYNRLKTYINQKSTGNELYDRIKNEILDFGDDNNDDAEELLKIIMDFEHDGFQFDDFFDYDNREFTRFFVWCCHAIHWGVQKYFKEMEDRCK